ncbi:putative inositol polyphosphate 5-phosphatase [Lachnellula subtilissima]|uniref:Putative inositol polyphosphate 5-phosphatase n=1 Tax=Lachnellula subtilissima TaxID=602034 RepID=A0A8H8RH13_9HELO|nr:putative inositol polyphosphate 5-phosphatase [Lachnellula subtilissima]
MEDSAEESLDGSSIKPVSSLRSHFEQMANSKPNNNDTPRAVSPKSQGHLGNGTGDYVKGLPGKQESTKVSGDSQQITRGRPRDLVDVGGLHPLRTSSNAAPSPSPTPAFRAKPASSIPPAVTIEPPQSPPKEKGLNLSVSSTPAYLSADAPSSAGSPSGRSSPRHFRIPSRPHTPLLEPGSLPPSQPPSPPPPRRSGEMRRYSSYNPLPPPINRAEKPKIASKPASLGFRNGPSALEPSPTRTSMDRPSPFSTPPSSSDSNPEHEIPAPLPRRPRPNSTIEALIRTSTPQKQFEPPPVHHVVISKRKDQEFNGLGRAFISPQVTGDPRPALPTRPPVTSEAQKLRVLSPPTSMMPPPPPRPSMDRKRPNLNTDTVMNPTPSVTTPKRISSTPTTQSQTPPRSHGRSMTVDRTSDRTPAEFRTPITTPVTPQRAASSASYITQTLSSTTGDYPDTSSSNRRAPVHKQGIHEISAGEKDAPRIMDVCGEFLCAASTKGIRGWSLRHDREIMTVIPEDGTKALSMAFKPTSDIEDEGSLLWVGNNIGEIIELNVAAQGVEIKKRNAHTRRDVIQIHRYLNQMWTIDESGLLYVWPPDSTGSPNLANLPSNPFRLPKGHTFSMIVGSELWHAAGKDIRIFVPTVDVSVQFQVLQRPLRQEKAGEVTSGAVISSQPDRVYFGHTDGKVSIYSREYEFIKLVHISVYKITSLVGVDGLLWAGFSTGMVYVYDTSQTPWVVKKDWHAHQDPIVRLLVDRSSFWTLNRSQVISLGQDNMFKVWDGLLEKDWIENQMQSQEGDFCDLSSVQALVMTWNAGASTPYDLNKRPTDESFFRNLLQSSRRPDILIFGFQELVDLEDKTRTAKSFFKSKKKDPHSEQEHMSHQYRDWRDYLTRCLDDYMPRDDLYHLLHTGSLVGLFTCIFVRAPLRERIRGVSAAEVKRGMGGLHGNKGALVVKFLLDDTSLCFVNCHLAAGQTQTRDRNADITAILDGSLFPAERDHSVRQDSYVGGGDGTMILDHEICVLNGDMNYRIDTMGRDTVANVLKANNLSKLLERDQLLASKRKNPWFKLRAFCELPITFPPTYKYDVGEDRYDTSEKRRSPAWCDRILYRGRDRVEQQNYERHDLRASDHRPVTGEFRMIIKTISPQKRAQKWEECHKQLVDMKERHGKDMMLDYLGNVIGFDAATSKELILQKQKSR